MAALGTFLLFLLLVKLCIIVSSGILVLLVLRHQIVHVRLSLRVGEGGGVGLGNMI